MKGFEQAEKEYTQIAQQCVFGDIDRSGSCALVALIIGTF